MTAPPVAVQRLTGRLVGQLRQANLGPVIALVLLWVVLALTTPSFTLIENQINLIRQNAILLILALGMTFVILTGNLDLSVGSLLAASGVLLATLLTDGVPPLGAILLTVLAATLFGLLVNGLLIGHLQLNSIVVTLGTLTAVRGAVFLVTDGQTVSTMGFPLIQDFANADVLRVPISGLVALGLVAVAWLLLRYSRFGRSVYAVGGSLQAAHHVGLNTGRVQMIVYGLSGAAAGIAGIIAVGRTGSASPLVGEGFELTAIAAVVLGGTAISGGVGGIVRTVVGVLFLGVLQNGMNLTGLQTFWQQVAVGVILIIAILVERLRPRRGR